LSHVRESSDSVDQDKIWTKYELIYDKNEDETKARAEFRFGGVFGTKLELTDQAHVKFNGNIIPFNSTLAYYETTLDGLVSSGTFTYTDVEGTTYTNTTGSIKSVEYPTSDVTITHGTDYVMMFTGPVITLSDVVTASFANKIFATAQIGASTITFGGVQTADITPGPYVGTMSRVVTQVPSQVTPEGGTILLTHKSLNKAITVQ
jgi:hypothetical protein